MKRFYTLIFISLLSLAFCSNLIAQTDTTVAPVELLSQYLEESTDNDNNQDLYDLIEDLLASPIDINSASVDDLMEIPFLDYKSANTIVEYRIKNGDYFSIYDLKTNNIIDLDTFSKIRYFIVIKASQKKIETSAAEQISWFNDIGAKMRVRTSYDLQERKGFIDGSYEGNRYKNYARLYTNYTDKFLVGGLIEKDAGEVSDFDHYTLFAQVNNLGFIDKAIVGDFSIEFGQGLALWSPYSVSKGSDAINPVIKRARGIKGYASSEENTYFKGAATYASYKNLALVLFASKKNRDASLNDLGEITSLPLDGFHRTISEKLKTNKVNETAFGGSINYTQNQLLNIGVLFFHNSYSNNFEKKDVTDFEGNSFNYLSASYKIYLNKLFISGETSFIKNSLATINNLEIIPTKKLSFIFSYRRYSKDYIALHAYGFGERSATKNESGFYSGARLRSKFGEFNLYYDIFENPYKTTFLPISTDGNEFLFNYSSPTLYRVKAVLRYKLERKDDQYLIYRENKILKKKRSNYRFDIRYLATKNFTFRTRFEYARLLSENEIDNEKGFLIFQDVRYQNKNLMLQSRFILFHTDSYNTRVYEFENDLLGVMYNPALYGKGYRFYFLAKYSLFNFGQISAKYAITVQNDRDAISSGLNEIFSNQNDKFSLQVDIKL